MIIDVRLDDILNCEINSRLRYTTDSLRRMENTLLATGQIVPIKVRRSQVQASKYEIIFGNRRVLAARKLKWKSVRAELVEATDYELMTQSLMENFGREDLTDYEKAVAFDKLNKDFGKTYDEIGKIAGISKSHISGYISMLRLFDQSDLLSNPKLKESMLKLTEHHARILTRVEDPKTREHLLFMVVNEKLSVKELSNIVIHLRSWFTIEDRDRESIQSAMLKPGEAEDIDRIRTVILDEFRLPQRGDFDRFLEMHMFDEGFSVFASFPPYCLAKGNEAVLRNREWFFEIMPKLSWKMDDLDVNLLNDTAVATFTVSYNGHFKNKPIKTSVRASFVLVRRSNEWKIFHEHWTKMDDNDILLTGGIGHHSRSARYIIP